MIVTGNENHGITLHEAAALTANYRNNNPGQIQALMYGKQAIMGIFTQSECMGVRIYFAQKADGAKTMVITGVDAMGNDMYNGQLAEFGTPCPSTCSVANPLNT